MERAIVWLGGGITLKENLKCCSFQPVKQGEYVSLFNAELEHMERFLSQVLHDFEVFFKTRNTSLISRIDQAIQTLFQWTDKETPLAPLLHFHNVRYHSVVVKDTMAILQLYYDNTLFFKENIETLKHLLAVSLSCGKKVKKEGQDLQEQ